MSLKKKTLVFVNDVILKNTLDLESAEKILKDIMKFVIEHEYEKDITISREIEAHLASILRIAALCYDKNQFQEVLGRIIQRKDD